MLLHSPAPAKTSICRSTRSTSPYKLRTTPTGGWALVLLLAAAAPMAGFAAAQTYGQQPYGDPATQVPAYGQQNPQDPQQDPPSRVARLSLAQGTVSLQQADAQDFSPAEVNYPLTTGDRLWADAGSLAELQLGDTAVRLGQHTDLTVTGLSDTLAQFGLAQGSVHLHTYSLDPGTTTELDTPNSSVTMLQPGDIRVDVYPANDLTVFTLLSGAAQVDAQGFSQQLRPGESLQLTGSDPVSARGVRRLRADALDSFSSNQDNTFQASLAEVDNYVSDDTIGASDLGNYGDWSSDAEYGAVWFPRSVSVGWQPYRYGHWAYVGPWGWTWIAAEPWGFAPFHYGRWNRFGDRWGWIPGPRVVRPVYSPALVAFVGGGAGAGVTAWFPLGPREPYQPWYRSSDRYVTRVNVTNIYNRNTAEVRNVYVNAGRGPTPFRLDPRRQYTNRGATVAVPQAVFAGGRPVHDAVLRVDGRQFAGAPVLQRPVGTPERTIFSPHPARALPPETARPQWGARGRGQGAPGQGWAGQNGQRPPASPSGPGSNDPGRNDQGRIPPARGGWVQGRQDDLGGVQPGSTQAGSAPAGNSSGGQGAYGNRSNGQGGTSLPALSATPAGEQPRHASPHPATPFQEQPGLAGQANGGGSDMPRQAPVDRVPNPNGALPATPGQAQQPQPFPRDGQRQPGTSGNPQPDSQPRMQPGGWNGSRDRAGWRDQAGSYNQPAPGSGSQGSGQSSAGQPVQPAPQRQPQSAAPQNAAPPSDYRFRRQEPGAFQPPARTAPTAAPPQGMPERPPFNRNDSPQQRPGFDQQRNGPQMNNNTPQNRPVAPPMQSFPRPAPQAAPPSQPQAPPNRPAPAAQPQGPPRPR